MKKTKKVMNNLKKSINGIKRIIKQKNKFRALLYVLKEILMFIIILAFKLTIIPSALLNLLTALAGYLSHDRISELFIYNKKNNRVEQMISLRLYWKIITNNFYKNKDKLSDILENIPCKTLLSNRKSKVTCTTNNIVYWKILRTNFGKNITYNNDEKIIAFQPAEKLMLMNSFVLWIHILDVRFWCYIFRTETINKYIF